MSAIYDDHGLRFRSPADWELEVIEEGSRTTVSLQSPGSAFAFVTIDDDGPPAKEEAEMALEAMRQEYPGLEVSATRRDERIAGHPAVGYDLDFFSLNVAVSCSIRSFQSPWRTALVFAQWSDLEADDAEGPIRGIRTSMEETDGA